MCLLEIKSEKLVTYYFVASCTLQKTSSWICRICSQFKLLGQILCWLTFSSFLISISSEPFRDIQRRLKDQETKCLWFWLIFSLSMWERENRTSGRNKQRLNICPMGAAESSKADWWKIFAFTLAGTVYGWTATAAESNTVKSLQPVRTGVCETRAGEFQSGWDLCCVLVLSHFVLPHFRFDVKKQTNQQPTKCGYFALRPQKCIPRL